ncbi:MAG: IS200/IS605 family transposase [Thermoguttaceae bacterium]|nr:IS200/IS605 family transposase [Thermoguttaceae bacterium]
MSHSCTQLHIHMIFSVKYRNCYLTGQFETLMHQKMREILEQSNCFVRAINGDRDHVHLFFDLHPSVSVAQIAQQIKGGTAHWINKEQTIIRIPGNFYWQRGYSAFSYSHSHIDAVVQYIKNQKAHHKTRTFHDEMVALCERFGVKLPEIFGVED